MTRPAGGRSLCTRTRARQSAGVRFSKCRPWISRGAARGGAERVELPSPRRPVRRRSGWALALLGLPGARAGALFGCAGGCGSRRAGGRCPGWSGPLRRRSRCGRPGSSRRARSSAGGCRCGRAARWPVRVPPVKKRERTLTSMRLPRREDGPLEVGRVHPRVEGRRMEHGAVLELEMRPCDCLVADEDTEERGGADALGRGGAAARGHLDEGVGPALARGAGQLVDARRAAQALLGLGTVGLEEVVLEAVELVRHNGARDRVQRHLAQPHAAESSTRRTRRARPCAPRRRPRPRRGRPAASNRPAPGRSPRSPALWPGRPASPRRGPWRPRCGGAGPRRWPGPGRRRWRPHARPRPPRAGGAGSAPRRTRRLAAGPGTRQRLEIHAPPSWPLRPPTPPPPRRPPWPR